jgi:Zn-dependent protease
MKWSWKLGRIAGIAVYVHATFLILIVWLGMRALSAGADLPTFLAEVAFVSLVFACIVLHELGHALAARRYGIETRDITLLPIGGIARLERMPDDAWQELVVALAGPAVNVAIGGGLFVLLSFAGGAVPAPPTDLWQGSLFERLMWVNVVILVFNLIPAFPMDGGRALRALLATRLPHVRATRIAAGLGQAFAIIFGLLGLVSNPFLVLIALFVWIGAAGELGVAELKSALHGIPVEQAMLTDFRTLEVSDPLAAAVELTLAGSQKDFPVLDRGRLVGVLGQSALLQALSRGTEASRVADAMAPAPRPAELRAPLGPLLERLQSESAQLIPVMRGGELAGIVTTDNVLELLQFRSAVETRPRAAAFGLLHSANPQPGPVGPTRSEGRRNDVEAR